MIGTIEELEKEIDQFQKNIMASGELVTLLGQMIDQVKDQNKSFEQKSDALITKVDNLPSAIEAANTASNQRIKNDVSSELEQALNDFRDEQNRYLSDLEQTRKKIQYCIDRSEELETNYNDEVQKLLGKLDITIAQIKEDNTKANNELESTFDNTLAKRNSEFADEQQTYIDTIHQSEQIIKAAEERLDKTYKKFIEALEKTDISNLYEQNQQLKNELCKRTNILTVITALSIIIGIVGFFI